MRNLSHESLKHRLLKQPQHPHQAIPRYDNHIFAAPVRNSIYIVKKAPVFPFLLPPISGQSRSFLLLSKEIESYHDVIWVL